RDTTWRSERCILASTTMGIQFGAAEMIRMAITRHGREVSCSTGSDQQRS
ncbi:hypothetical protein S245_047923, partial [Arachis hypogaea]